MKIISDEEKKQVEGNIDFKSNNLFGQNQTSGSKKNKRIKVLLTQAEKLFTNSKFLVHHAMRKFHALIISYGNQQFGKIFAIKL